MFTWEHGNMVLVSQQRPSAFDNYAISRDTYSRMDLWTDVLIWYAVAIGSQAGSKEFANLSIAEYGN
jgi:hypothetical protein